MMESVWLQATMAVTDPVRRTAAYTELRSAVFFRPDFRPFRRPVASKIPA